MEVAGLYGVAHERGAKALGVCTVSDDLLTGADLTAEERQETLSAMIEITLGAIA
jgi:purine-nucleoside phosphorylase